MSRRGLRSVPVLLASAALVFAACGGDDDTDSSATTVTPTTDRSSTTEAPTTSATPTTTEAPSTTEPPATSEPAPDVADEVTAYATAGRFPVGVTTLQLPDDGPLVEVWYPAIEGTTGTDTYDVRDFVPEAIRELLTDGSQATFTVDAARDAAVSSDGPFPLVGFSHGFTGMRLQSSFLTSHLASHGMVVVAPDHPSRDLTNVLGGTASGDRDAAIGELLGAIELAIAAGGDPDSRIAGAIDADRIAVLGHSAGGGTVLGAALDPRVDAYVSMAAGGPVEGTPFPEVPSFFLAGELDAVVTPEQRTRPAFEAAPEPSWYWELADTGHNGFDDFCAFGGGTGIIGVAEASGLGPLLDAQPQLRTLGEDGCIPPSAPVEQAWPIIRHGVTAWLRWQLGLDDQLVGFGPDVADAYDLRVTLAAR